MPPLQSLLSSTVIAAVLTLRVASNANGDDADPVGEALVKQGYTKTLLHRDRYGLLYCDLKFDKKPHRLYLDTGAATTTVSDKVVDGMGIMVTTVTSISQGWGGGEAKTYDARIPPKVQVTPFRLPARVDVSVGFGIQFLSNLSAENAVGILGMDALNHQSAVIDAGRGTMYTIDPWEKEKGLVGEWKAVSVVTGGQEPTAEYVASVKLRFENGAAKLTSANNKTEQVFDIDFVRTTGDVRAFNWYSGERNSPWRLIYKLTGDELVICCPFTFTDPKRMSRPTEFKSTKENEHALFRFKRVAGEKKK